jgi:hypothetical protein
MPSVFPSESIFNNDSVNTTSSEKSSIGKRRNTAAKVPRFIGVSLEISTPERWS